MGKVKRSIKFYSVAIGKKYTIDGQETVWILNSKQEIAEAVVHGFQRINQLPCRLDAHPSESRYLKYRNDTDLMMIVDSIDEKREQIEGRLVLCRRDAFPEIEKEGTLSNIVLEEGSGIAEITHFVYFYTKKVIGIEFNFHGSKSKGLGDYLMEKLHPYITFVELHPVITKEWCNLLMKEDLSLTMLSIRATKDALYSLKMLNPGIESAVDAGLAFGEVEEVEIVLRRKAHTKKSFKSSLFDWLGFLKCRNPENKKIPGINSCKVSIVEEDSYRTVNLIEEQLCVSAEVELETGKTKTINAYSAYQAIKYAFEECKVSLVVEGLE